MYVVFLLLGALLITAIVLFVGISAGVKSSGTRRIFVFLALTALPALWTMGLLVRADSTLRSAKFCLACHEMAPFGESLESGDQDLLAASHYQNGWINRQRACYDCHTEPGIGGFVDAKLTGIHDLRVHFLGTIPEKIELRRPYPSSICISCHGERDISERDGHSPGLLREVMIGNMTCVGCHGPAHGELRGAR
jgi:nitrate/TMAO reductase-like tetraheme cytochrome c subunit